MALDNHQRLISHKIQLNQITYVYYICINRILHEITKGRYVIKPNQNETYIYIYIYIYIYVCVCVCVCVLDLGLDNLKGSIYHKAPTN